MDYHGETIDTQPCTDWKAIQTECAKHQRFVVRVEKYDEEREISRQQMAYLHAVVFPTLAKAWDTSYEDAEFECKKKWGEQWLIKKVMGYRFVLTKTTLTVKQCNAWIENIWQGAHREGILIAPPDKDWREAARKMKELRHG